MASIELSDGREIPIVKPHIGDQMELERQMRALRPKYGPADFKEDMELSGFQTAFALFASFNRAGVKTSIGEVLELDLEALGSIVKRDPGDEPEDEEAEGEQSEDPQPAPTDDDAGV